MEQTGHSVTINGREDITVTGVEDVPSFTDLEVYMKTNKGMLVIRGEKLNVKNLSTDKGVIKIEGIIDGLIYTKSKHEKSGKSFTKRLFS
ncbi:MAG: sporulation protein YabP [Clostridiales bacterium]|nr:sporulation protein YabP [Clostridiales bacterium]